MKLRQRMKNKLWKWPFRNASFVALLIIVIGTVSCKDEYYYDDKEPEWLGASIYDYLKSVDNYETYIKLIDDVGYADVLSKTGSKTLFVADDDAFDRFYQSNPWGVTSYKMLSLSQKKMILNFGMINNAYLIETLANYYDGNNIITGSAIRRLTANSALDSVAFEKDDDLPDNKYWDAYRNKGLYLLTNQSSSPLVSFLEKPLMNAGISDGDFKIITGVDRSSDDAYIFNRKVIQRDITCKNGYLHVLDDVLIPPTNMAESIRKEPSTSIFSSLLERFSTPHYNDDVTMQYKVLHPGFSDSIFSKKYFASYGEDENFTYPDGSYVPTELMLPYDPGWNAYFPSYSGASLQSDMGAVFAPNDEAMKAYFDSGSGKILKDRYGSWKNVPDEIIALLLRRHMRESFIQSVPSRFGELKDSENSALNISVDHVVNSILGVNGVVYETNHVYPPDDYVSVYGPILFSDKTRIYNWGILMNDFRLYLNSLVSTYSFFVPTDDFFKGYIDPISSVKDVPGVLKYWYNEKTNSVNATVYSYNNLTGEIGDSIQVITNSAFLSNRLLDILDSHIVVGDVESGEPYYFTKGGNILKVEGVGLSMKVKAGGDIENGTEADVTDVYSQENGKTFFINKPLQTPLKSVYKVLSETPQFSLFFELLSGFPAESNSVMFVKEKNSYGLDYNIKFFNTFNYTVFVPTNEAIQTALDQGLIQSWETINAPGLDESLKEEYIVRLERFLRYHFQDNSVFVGGSSFSEVYQTATIKENDASTQFRTYKDKYYKLGIESNGTDLYLSTENWGEAKVKKDEGLYNIFVRDYVFNNDPISFKEIDGTGIGSSYYTSQIVTSSTAVIHQIDNILKFE